MFVKRYSAIRTAVDSTGNVVEISVLRIRDKRTRCWTWTPSLDESRFVLGLRTDGRYEHPNGNTYLAHVAVNT